LSKKPGISSCRAMRGPRSRATVLCALLCACPAVAAFFVPPLPRAAPLPGNALGGALGDVRRRALRLACGGGGDEDRSQLRVQRGRASTRNMNVEQLQARCPRVWP